MVKKKVKAKLVEPAATVAAGSTDGNTKKRKVKHKRDEEEVQLEPQVKKLKKKKKSVQNNEVKVQSEPPVKKLKMKKKLKAKAGEGVPARMDEGEDKIGGKKRKKSHASESQETKGSGEAPLAKKVKKGKRATQKSVPTASSDAVQESSSDDEFFAHDGKEKPGENKEKTPDHLNPGKVFVGNLPWAATEEGVHALFAKCGKIERFDMPLNDLGKASGNAYIYYEKEDSVARALEHDGADYQGRPLKVRRAERQNKEGKGKNGKGGKGKDSKDGKGKEGGGRPSNNERTVFVGGLSYETEYDTLKRDFEECGEVEAIRMVKNEEGAFKGIAFVVYKDESGVVEALKYHGDQYEGRTLVVRRAGEKGSDSKGSKGKDEKGKGKGKKGGKEKGSGKGKGICFKFKEGKCPFGDQCIFAHE